MSAEPCCPITVCLVGCGKTKQGRAAPARELYTGSLFRAARRYAEGCDEWRIVSARYGLIAPERVIEPYDYALQWANVDERLQWATTVVSLLCSDFAGLGFEVVLLAGVTYASPLRTVLEKRGIVVRSPLDGMPIGRRLAWLARNA